MVRPACLTASISSWALARPDSRSAGSAEGIGRFVKRAQVLGILPHGREDHGRRVRIGKGRDVGAVEDRLARGDFVAAHPTGQHGLAFDMAEGLELLGGGRGVGHGLRGENDQQAVAVRVAAGDFEGLGVKLGAGVADDVNRVVVAPDRRAGTCSARPSSPSTPRPGRRRWSAGHRSPARPGRRRW